MPLLLLFVFILYDLLKLIRYPSIFVILDFVRGLLLVQRLEFLGDSVLDYLMTKHFYLEYPGLSPEQLTDMRSASVNNECYARSAVKFRLHEHILRDSQELDKQIVETCNNFEKLSSESTFGWDAETTFTEVISCCISFLVDFYTDVWFFKRPNLYPCGCNIERFWLFTKIFSNM